MGRYHLSYDVEESTPERNHQVLTDLVKMLVEVLKASYIKRPVHSTVLFDTTKTEAEVMTSITSWRVRNNIYYYLSKVEVSTKNNFIDRWRPRQKLVDDLDKEVCQMRGSLK